MQQLRQWFWNAIARLKALWLPRPRVTPPVPQDEFNLSALKLLVKLRRVWANALDLNPIQLYRILRTPMGEALLAQLRLPAEAESPPADKSALRQALDRVAEEVNEDITSDSAPFDVSHHVWIRLRLDRDRLAAATRQFEQLAADTETIGRAIAALAEAEAAADPVADYAKLPDLCQPGEFDPERLAFEIEDACREARQFQVVAYRPHPWRSPRTPVVVMSHGLGSAPHDFHEYASYLASRGYFVVLPQHLGSDADRVGAMLSGRASDIFDLHEFVERPWDVSCLLDRLERRNASDYDGHLDLSRVGAIGHSFGGYTVLALAGAEIDFDKLERACEPVLSAPNPSLLLQCRALALPRQVYDLRDRRIQAIIPIDPVGSEVFDPIGTRHVRIPTLAIAGSEDRAAPAIWEPIRIFPWLRTRDRYLALMQGKAHFGTFSASQPGFKRSLSQALQSASASVDPKQFYDYAYALSLAFLEVYVAGNAAYRTFLRAAYASYLSHSPCQLYLLSAASADALERELHELKYLAEFVW
ncbi:MAG: dienelactone hydrolase family protein [Cyanobacteria bacterium J06639_1]